MKYAPFLIFLTVILTLAIRSLVRSKGRTRLMLFSLVAGCAVTAMATGLISLVTATQQEFYYSPTALCIQKGLTTTAGDGTVTQAFGVAYNLGVPLVFTCVNSNANVTTNEVYTVTTTNFVLKCGSPGILVQWMSVGAP